MNLLQNLDLQGEKVVMRVDFNVPLDEEFKITDDTRIRLSLPSIKYLLERDCQVYLLAHLGRPQKKKLENGDIDEGRFTLQHLVGHLTALVGTPVRFSTLESALDSEYEEKIILVENTRFFAEEKKGDEAFAKKLSTLGDYYINDAFGAAHRAHASTAVMAQFYDKEHKAIGLLMQKEIEQAKYLLHDSEKPFTAIVGGAKVSDKIGVILKLIERCDNILIGGAMAYTFIKAKGGNTGTSLVEEDKLDLALETLKIAKQNDTNILLPIDSVTASEFRNDAQAKIVESSDIPFGWMGLDIGPKAIQAYSDVILNSKTVFWNGPMGVFEMSSFATGTNSIAKAVAKMTSDGGYSLIGGGDSVAAINQSGLDDQVSFISSGGGAMLEYLEGKELPGLKAIES